MAEPLAKRHCGGPPTHAPLQDLLVLRGSGSVANANSQLPSTLIQRLWPGCTSALRILVVHATRVSAAQPDAIFHLEGWWSDAVAPTVAVIALGKAACMFGVVGREICVPAPETFFENLPGGGRRRTTRRPTMHIGGIVHQLLHLQFHASCLPELTPDEIRQALARLDIECQHATVGALLDSRFAVLASDVAYEHYAPRVHTAYEIDVLARLRCHRMHPRPPQEGLAPVIAPKRRRRDDTSVWGALLGGGGIDVGPLLDGEPLADDAECVTSVLDLIFARDSAARFILTVSMLTRIFATLVTHASIYSDGMYAVRRFLARFLDVVGAARQRVMGNARTVLASSIEELRPRLAKMRETGCHAPDGWPLADASLVVCTIPFEEACAAQLLARDSDTLMHDGLVYVGPDAYAQFLARRNRVHSSRLVCRLADEIMEVASSQDDHMLRCMRMMAVPLDVRDRSGDAATDTDIEQILADITADNFNNNRRQEVGEMLSRANETQVAHALDRIEKILERHERREKRMKGLRRWMEWFSGRSRA